jgi:hypothetical protein
MGVFFSESLFEARMVNETLFAAATWMYVPTNPFSLRRHALSGQEAPVERYANELPSSVVCDCVGEVNINAQPWNINAQPRIRIKRPISDSSNRGTPPIG